MKLPISVTILTKNSQKCLAEVLTALQSFDEVVICDTGSQDNTLTIARQFENVSFYERSFIGFGSTHNIASNLARHDWILSIDSDEIVTSDLIKEIQSLSLMRGHVYSVPRHNEYRGKWIRYCDWHPDRQHRLYHRLDTKFNEAQVHEAIETKHLKKIPLESHVKHYSYNTISDFLNKMESYSSLFAKQYQGKKNSSFGKSLITGIYIFFRSYFLKRGILAGREGFEISFYNACTAFYKYLKLAEANDRLRADQQESVEKFDDALKKKPIV